ncbi:uncharacterized protein LOC126774345 isoform X2 [Nymphalis io]|nr:uncharacterized protein LOC126774345 isoform X2 [Nymphalis io]
MTITRNTSENTASQSSNFVNDTNFEHDMLDYFYGNQSDSDKETEDNLDFSMMDIDTLKKLYENAHKSNFTNETESMKTIARFKKSSDEAAHDVPFFMSKAIDLMKQSVYATRYRLQDTKPLRKKFARDPCYNLAIYYGSLMQLRIKLDNVYATLMKLSYRFKFIWFLILYERCLALNVDVTSIVAQMFKIKNALLEVLPEDSLEN